jgi:hypothetical protein
MYFATKIHTMYRPTNNALKLLTALQQHEVKSVDWIHLAQDRDL